MDGAELRRIRRRLLLTQASLGLKLKVAGNTVSRWERNVLPIKESVAIAVRAMLRDREDEERKARGG